MNKSFIRILLVLSVIISIPSFVFAAGEEEDAEWGLISAISNADNYISDTEAVTRGEFACALADLLEIGMLSGEDIGFSDVTAGSELHKLLSRCVAAGIVSNGGAFRPDDALTYDEAAKMCTSALGYGLACEANGGYPSGYISRAASLEIFKNTKRGAVIGKKDAFIILYNTVNAPIMSVRYAKNGLEEYVEGDETFLGKYKNIEKIKGIVTSDEYTELGVDRLKSRGVSELSGTIGIDGRLYTADGDFNGYIGSRVIAFLKDDKKSGDEKIIYVCSDKNKKVTLTGGDLEYKSGEIHDFSANRKYRINKSCDIIVNGKTDYKYNLSDVDKLVGDITLISNKNTNEYNVIIINSYKYMRVETYDKRSLILRDLSNPNNTAVLKEDGAYKVWLDDEDREGNLGSIETGSYIALAASDDYEVGRIIMLGKIVSGTVKSVGEDKITVGETSCDMADFFMEGDLKRVVLGKEFGFYLGLRGEVVAINYFDTGFIYAYLIKAYKSEDNENDITLKVFTQRGEMARYKLSDKVKLDGVSGKKPDSVYASVSGEQLIRVLINSEHKIDAIDTADVKNTYTDAELDGLRDDNRLTRCKFANSYYYRNNWFYPYFYATGATIFKIPKDTGKEDDYEIGYSFDEGDSADGSFVEAYDVGINGTAGAIVVHVDTTDMDQVARINANMIIVDSVYEKLDGNGDVVTAISGYRNGKFSEYIIGADAKIEKFYQSASLEAGDIIRVNLRDNVITALVVEFVGSSVKKNSTTGASPSNCRSTASHFQIGSVWAMKDGGAIISNSLVSEGVYDYSPKNFISVKIPSDVLVFNTSKKKLTVSDLNAVKSYLNSGSDASYTVTWQVYGGSRFTVIYTDGEDE